MSDSNVKVKIQEGDYSISVSVLNENKQSVKLAALAAIAAKEAADEIIIRAKHNSSYVEEKLKSTDSSFISATSIEASIKVPSEKELAQIKDDDVFKVRERIPNNAIDIKDLKIGKADTENALVRCPNCGQSHAILTMDDFNYYLMVRDFDKKEFVYVGESIHVSEDKEDVLTLLNNIFYKEKVKGKEISKDDYFKDLQDILSNSDPSLKLDIVIDNDSLILCPVCQKKNEFINWKDAFVNPISWFEFNEICDACGGELIGANTKNSTKSKRPQFELKCESCGHEQEKVKK